MTDRLLRDFTDVRKCGCGCDGLELFLADAEVKSFFIAPYGSNPGQSPDKYYAITELMHPLVISELWEMREIFFWPP